MKVKALKEALSSLPDDLDVLTGVFTEDYVHTLEAQVLTSKEEGVFIGFDVEGLESIIEDLKSFQE